MTLWRLELLRLTRTHLWMLVVGTYVFFGTAGPLLARYLREILSNFGGGEVTIVGPDPQPVDGIVQFVSNGSQLGLLSVVVLAASALTLGAHPEFEAFLRTKVTGPHMLVLPRFGVAVATAVAALWIGTGIACVVTVVLLGGLPTGPMVVGTLLGSVYLAFAVSVVAATASMLSSVAATVFASVAVLLMLPIAALAPALAPWLPSELLVAVAGLIDGNPSSDYLPATAVALLSGGMLLLFAERRIGKREL